MKLEEGVQDWQVSKKTVQGLPAVSTDNLNMSIGYCQDQKDRVAVNRCKN